VSGEITLDIMGVVADARHRDLREGFVPMIYHPAAGHLRVATLLVRTSSPPSQTMSLARDIVHQIEPSLPVGEAGRLRDDIDTNLAEERLLARLGSVIALIAGLLAVSGLYAVIAFFVNERVRELAIRMALGASGVRVVGLVLRRVVAILLVGFAAGLGLVLASSRVLASRLFGVAPLDPPTLAAAVVLLGGAALLAAWFRSPAPRSCGPGAPHQPAASQDAFQAPRVLRETIAAAEHIRSRAG
jgi:predicted lysophospholipase L1 biosynthesis ABC-type transport system permease subunit